MPLAPIKTETLLHKEAFECYYSLGHSRNCKEVALLLGHKHRTVQRWSRSLKWVERVKHRDNSIARKLEEMTIETIVERKAHYLEILAQTLDHAMGKIETDDLGIRDQKELIATINESLKLLGEPEKHNVSGEIDVNMKGNIDHRHAHLVSLNSLKKSYERASRNAKK